MHVGGHLRDAFHWAVDEHGEVIWWLPPESPVEGEHRGEQLSWGRLLGLLWNCTDVVPADYCTDLDFPQGSNYAQLVRSLKASTRG